MTPSDRLVSFAKVAEGFSDQAYWDSNGKCWTCGYGETQGVTENTTTTESEAAAQLVSRLQEFGDSVERLVKVPLTQDQYDALTDFAYNVGTGNLQSSTLLRKLNAGDYEGASSEFQRWNRSGGKILPGLSSRRLIEARWFSGTTTQ